MLKMLHLNYDLLAALDSMAILHYTQLHYTQPTFNHKPTYIFFSVMEVLRERL